MRVFVPAPRPGAAIVRPEDVAKFARTQARCEAAQDRIGDLQAQRDDLQAQRDLWRAEVGALRARAEAGPTPPDEG
ncbi:hypothetical protein ACWDR1_23145 [Streptosporangium sandarakinum]